VNISWTFTTWKAPCWPLKLHKWLSYILLVLVEIESPKGDLFQRSHICYLRKIPQYLRHCPWGTCMVWVDLVLSHPIYLCPDFLSQGVINSTTATLEGGEFSQYWEILSVWNCSRAIVALLSAWLWEVTATFSSHPNPGKEAVALLQLFRFYFSPGSWTSFSTVFSYWASGLRSMPALICFLQLTVFFFCSLFFLFFDSLWLSPTHPVSPTQWYWPICEILKPSL
jgi:hypothetical protein